MKPQRHELATGELKLTHSGKAFDFAVGGDLRELILEAPEGGIEVVSGPIDEVRDGIRLVEVAMRFEVVEDLPVDPGLEVSR